MPRHLKKARLLLQGKKGPEPESITTGVIDGKVYAFIALERMVGRAGACSTDLMSPEDVDHLCGKCDKYAAVWKEQADRLWGC